MRRGILKIGSAERIGALVLPGLLKRFKELYPNIRIDIVEENSMILEEKLLMGALDLAILCLPLKNTNVNYHVFYEEPLYAAIPVSYTHLHQKDQGQWGKLEEPHGLADIQPF